MAYSPIWGEFAKKYGYDPQSFNGSLPEYMKFRDQWWNNYRSNLQQSGFLNPLQQQQPVGPTPQQQAGWNQLASIADQLRAKQAIKPPLPTTPGMIGKPTPTPVDYVQSDRLQQGKGFSKFARQARGTDRYSMVKQLINQYYK